MSEQNARVRLGAALIIGADACHAVHVHTDRDGVDRIARRIQRLGAKALGLPSGEFENVTAVLGGSREADVLLGRVLARDVEALVAAVLAEDEGADRG